VSKILIRHAGAPDQMLATHARIAEHLLERVVGLLGRASLEAGEALVFPRCRAIHTVGMRFPIDVMFIDQAWRVVALNPSVPPGRLLGPIRSAWGTIEMASGAIQRCQLNVGEQLDLIDAANTS